MPIIKLQVGKGDVIDYLSVLRSAFECTDLSDDGVSLTAFFPLREGAKLFSGFGISEYFVYGASRYRDVVHELGYFNEFNLTGAGRVDLSERYDVPVYDWDEKRVGYRLLVTCAEAAFRGVESFCIRRKVMHHVTEVYGSAGKMHMIGCEFLDRSLAVDWLMELEAASLGLVVESSRMSFCRSVPDGCELPKSIEEGILNIGSALRVNAYSSDAFSVNPMGMLRSIPNVRLSALLADVERFEAIVSACSLVSLRRQSFGWRAGAGAFSRRQSGNYISVLWRKRRVDAAIGVEQYSDGDVPVRLIKSYLKGKIL
jgi:hypothetical protein